MILPLRNKPTPAALLDSAHPFCRGLVCAVLMHEPGNASGNLRGSGLLLGTSAAGGLQTSITAAHEPWYNGFGSGYTFCLWHSGITLGSWEPLLTIGDSTLAWQRYSSSGYFKNYHSGSGVTMSNFLLSEIAEPGMLACTWNGSAMRAYVDAVEVGDVAMYAIPKTDSTTSTLTIGGSCTVYLFLMYDRALSLGEIQRLHRDPLALFAPPRHWPPAVISGGSTQYLAGSISAIAELSATAGRVRTMSGACAAEATVAATLGKVGEVMLSGSVTCVSSVSALLVLWSWATASGRRDWMAGALFHGMTPSAHKLGTVLTGGWFWVRRAGCSAIYRGQTPAQMDFDNILCVARRDVMEVTLPAHVSHEPGSSHCYVVRRFNGSGNVERTDSAAVMVRVDATGNLAAGAPNGVSGLGARRVQGNRVRLAWSYSPLDQQVAPEVFRVYWDGGTGQINLIQPLAEIPYRGRSAYSYHSDVLNEGTYAFVVRARSEELVEDASLQSVTCSIETFPPEAVTILAAEAIP